MSLYKYSSRKSNQAESTKLVLTVSAQPRASYFIKSGRGNWSSLQHQMAQLAYIIPLLDV